MILAGRILLALASTPSHRVGSTCGLHERDERVLERLRADALGVPGFLFLPPALLLAQLDGLVHCRSAEACARWNGRHLVQILQPVLQRAVVERRELREAERRTDSVVSSR